MEHRKKKDDAPDMEKTNRFGSTSEVPVAQPWILPPDWPPEELL